MFVCVCAHTHFDAHVCAHMHASTYENMYSWIRARTRIYRHSLYTDWHTQSMCKCTHMCVYDMCMTCIERERVYDQSMRKCTRLWYTPYTYILRACVNVGVSCGCAWMVCITNAPMLKGSCCTMYTCTSFVCLRVRVSVSVCLCTRQCVRHQTCSQSSIAVQTYTHTHTYTRCACESVYVWCVCESVYVWYMHQIYVCACVETCVERCGRRRTCWQRSEQNTTSKSKTKSKTKWRRAARCSCTWCICGLSTHSSTG